MKLVILPGDGIGPEIVAATRVVLSAASERFGLGLEFEEHAIGEAALASDGITLPDEVFERAAAADGVVLGPVSTASYPPRDEGGLNPSAEFRRRMDLFANIRPSRSVGNEATLVKDMDLVIVRENTEGFYADRTMFAGSGEFMPDKDMALAVRKITREGAGRIGRAAAELAMTRRKKLTIVTKSNVLKLSDGLFLEAAKEAASAFPEVAVDEVLVDAMASHLVRSPSVFDVIVTSNMFGDVLSNEAAELAGGLGFAGSLNAGAKHAVAQAAHGSAPDIAGQDVANPSSLMLSSGMLLDWLADRSDSNALRQGARAIEKAVMDCVAAAESRTRDTGGSLGTAAFGTAVARRVSDA
ncbi:isocitrate/isopropylmalate family dehydrogenase [Nisaea acidiphila]|uniref:Isocitrate/isopropylmalate family dehydrogenase n=1 Tax=Nisaea acidiphila TaxID=1862145 RepID=A0A9J7ATI4_9PROT|nr:isocitrate/isopropylmalate family dehydrogenase [Nisaea acidiphila]UUX49793.1 isocitrate/isopropylmalate family dehydrogenase [Nisaea acidiphila]